MIPLAIPNIAGREAEYLQECNRSTFFLTFAPFVGKFDAAVAETSGANFCVATSAGATALHAGLSALAIGPGDLVICPSLTFIAMANAISHAAAAPWLLDVSANSSQLQSYPHATK